MLLSSGAEAVIYLEELMGRKLIRKVRPRKGYRIRELDEKLRINRTKKEAKLIHTARMGGVNAPAVIDVHEDQLIMEFIEGKRLDILLKENEGSEGRVMRELGEQVAKMHNSGVVHNDLTVVNIIVGGKVYIIDFGLGEFSRSLEDRAVDIFVLIKSLKASVPEKEEIIKDFFSGYSMLSGYEDVLKRVREVEKRGRYRV
ncbi:KEOPS complex kinase/ATPase Bud32 [Candidatus Methanodesulfokora washburnensis]|jgi:Kae1-associated kinase Bud32|uniref:non-specific serine/threonine protein kinase n=1 Tax=Candidatus Methanodesulfokora washburnensis TaxID=2478471 RepID=A0A3R9QWI0_9CREN|nr:KEOPS complex kinase/ATPase Bud32 [Candidatus Methanodesulfokores washburnensis]RSN75093.1 Kae1-associated serine/threonine protein kinase [Candidatus Methanodesulfokores washburnensis]